MFPVTSPHSSRVGQKQTNYGGAPTWRHPDDELISTKGSTREKTNAWCASNSLGCHTHTLQPLIHTTKRDMMSDCGQHPSSLCSRMTTVSYCQWSETPESLQARHELMYKLKQPLPVVVTPIKGNLFSLIVCFCWRARRHMNVNKKLS